MFLSPPSKRFLNRYMYLVDDLNLEELFNKASLEFNDTVINEISNALIEVGISTSDIHQAKINNCIRMFNEIFEDLHGRNYKCDSIRIETFFEVYLLNKLGLSVDDVYEILTEYQSTWSIAVYEASNGKITQRYISIL